MLKKVHALRKLLNMKYSLFSIIFLSASTMHSWTFLPVLSWNRQIKIVFFGAAAMCTARALGMIVNQLVDLSFDKRNPRTMTRVLPEGLLSCSFSKWLSVICLAFFLFFCYLINTICLILGILVALIMTIYPYAKRCTYLCHWILGSIYYIAIVMNFCALVPLSITTFSFASSLGLAVGFIITANDIIYAIQDIKFDRQEGLYSIPALVGPTKAIVIASACLVAALFAYYSLWAVLDFKKIFIITSLSPTTCVILTIKTYWKCLKFGEIHQCFFNSNVLLASAFLANAIICSLF